MEPELPLHKTRSHQNRTRTASFGATDPRYLPEEEKILLNSIDYGGIPQRPTSVRRHKRQQPSQVFIPPLCKEDEILEKEEPDESTNNNPCLLQTSATGATLLIGIQILSKLASFTLNQLLLWIATPAIFAINAHLEFLLSTLLFFSREATRLALQRLSLNDKKADIYVFGGGVVQDTISGTSQAIINMGYISILLGIFLSIVTIYAYHCFYYPYSWAVALIGLAAIVELISEPYYVLAMQQLRFKSRALAESLAILFRCIITVSFTLAQKGTQGGIIAFCLGQLAYAIIFSTLYIYLVRGTNRERQFSFCPQRIQPFKSQMEVSQQSVITHNASSYYLEPQTSRLALSIWVQTIFKHILTEGDRILISYCLPLYDQGVYAMVFRYGSLIARIIFFPIEEALRTFFANLLGSSFISKSDLRLSRQVLINVSRVYLYLGFFFTIFGPSLIPPLTFKILPSWGSENPLTSPPAIMGVFSLYIPFMALNGALESFVQSVASPSDIRSQATAMSIFMMIFAIIAFVLMKTLDFGARGLIYANIINMITRIAWCTMYIHGYYLKKQTRSLSITNLLPGKITTFISICCMSMSMFLVSTTSFSHISINVVLSIIFITTIIIEEWKSILQLLKLIINQPASTTRNQHSSNMHKKEFSEKG